MPRPKTGKPPKKSLNLTVSEATREDLDFLSSYYGESISALVCVWAAREAAALRGGAEKELPSARRTLPDNTED